MAKIVIFQTNSVGRESLVWLSYLVSIAALICFLMASSIYCDWPFPRESALYWVGTLRIRLHNEYLLRSGRAASTSTPQAQSKEWAQIDLRFNLIEELLSERNCRQSPLHLAACVAVVNRLLDFGSTRSEFVPGPGSFWARLIGWELADFQFAHIQRRISNASVDLHKTYLANKKELKQRQLYWQEMRLLNEPLFFENVAAWLRREFVTDLNESELTATAYNTYLELAEDPHTQILPLTVYDSLYGSADQELWGLGMELRRLGDNIYISYLTDSGPAERAGLRPYDIIHGINRTPLVDATLQRVREQLSSSQQILLQVSRAGKMLSFTLNPTERWHLHTVATSLFSGQSGLTGYLRIRGFSSGVCQAVRSSLEYFNRNEVRSLIIDLRGNRGGNLQEGLCLAGLFIGSGQLIARVESLFDLKQPVRLVSVDSTPLTKQPLLVVIDSRTASVAELFAAAIRETKKGLLLGERTFGKGTVQVGRSWSRNTADDISKKFMYFSTLSRMTPPSGNSFHARGLMPDVEIYSSPWPQEYEKFSLREEDHPFYLAAGTASRSLPLTPGPTIAAWRAKIDSCRAVVDVAAGRYVELERAGLRADYVLLAAQYWASCLP